jgi:hypothetical protein
VDGQRFRQSLETSDWREAQKKEKLLVAQAESGKLGASAGDFRQLGFSEAASRYLQGRMLDLSESSRKKEGFLLAKPRKFFANDGLSKITGERLLQFREWRIKDQVSHATINMEMGVIRRILSVPSVGI